MKRGICPQHSGPKAERQVPFLFIASEASQLCLCCIEEGLWGQAVYEEARLSHPDFFLPTFLEDSHAS